ncbi:MAG TPA: hypothetical protein VFO77_16530, partial [Actinoplanes sp.]|nr:hypothetical protein [Actinoplanes sp.]
MRRILAAFATAAVLVPGAVTAAPGSALAATNKLTVTTISRTGAKIKTEVSVENLTTHFEYRLTSGKARKLPKGWYAVLADVYTAEDESNTLGARVVKVSGNTKTTIDARRGKPLKVSLSPAVPDASQQLTGSICLNNDNSSASVWASNQPGRLYVVPHTSKNLQFAYVSQWSAYSPTGQRSEYVDAGGRTGVPKSFTRTVKQSGLARVATQVRRGPSGSPDSHVMARPDHGNGCLRELSATLASDEAPFKIDAYLSPGKWRLEGGTWYETDFIGSQNADRTFAAGKSHSQIFFRSAWG